MLILMLMVLISFTSKHIFSLLLTNRCCCHFGHHTIFIYKLFVFGYTDYYVRMIERKHLLFLLRPHYTNIQDRKKKTTRFQKKTHQSTSRVLIACIFMFVKLFMECGGCVRVRATMNYASLLSDFCFVFGFFFPISNSYYVFCILSLIVC